MNLSILIADDHAIVRKGLIQILKEAQPKAQVYEANNAIEVYQLIKKQVWDIILLDIFMPSRNGTDLLKQLSLAIQKVLSGKKYISDFVANQLLDKPNHSIDKPLQNQLSDRELQVFELMAKGKSVSEIAEVEKLTSIKGYIYTIFYNLIYNSIKYQNPQVNPSRNHGWQH